MVDLDLTRWDPTALDPFPFPIPISPMGVFFGFPTHWDPGDLPFVHILPDWDDDSPFWIIISQIEKQDKPIFTILKGPRGHKIILSHAEVLEN